MTQSSFSWGTRKLKFTHESVARPLSLLHTFKKCSCITKNKNKTRKCTTDNSLCYFQVESGTARDRFPFPWVCNAGAPQLRLFPFLTLQVRVHNNLGNSDMLLCLLGKLSPLLLLHSLASLCFSGIALLMNPALQKLKTIGK